MENGGIAMIEFSMSKEELNSLKWIAENHQEPRYGLQKWLDKFQSKKPIETLNEKNVREIIYIMQEEMEAGTAGYIIRAADKILKLSPQPEPSKSQINIVVEELEDLNEYFHESGKEQLEEEQIELLAKNILSKLNIEYLSEDKVRERLDIELRKLFKAWKELPAKFRNFTCMVDERTEFETNMVKELSQLAQPKSKNGDICPACGLLNSKTFRELQQENIKLKAQPDKSMDTAKVLADLKEFFDETGLIFDTSEGQLEDLADTICKEDKE